MPVGIKSPGQQKETLTVQSRAYFPFSLYAKGLWARRVEHSSLPGRYEDELLACAGILLEALPPIVHIRKGSDKAAMGCLPRQYGRGQNPKLKP